MSDLEPKTKARRPAYDRHSETNGVRADVAPTPAAPARHGPFYAAGPALSLGAPVQRKVAVGQPGDTYEREADAVAERVTAGQSAPPISTLAPGGLGAAQRQQAPTDPRQEEQPGRQRVQRASEKPGDEPVQREAADEQPVQSLVQRASEKPGDEPVQRASEKPDEPVQREAADEQPVQSLVQRASEKPDEPVQRASEKPDEPVQREVADEQPVQSLVQRASEKPGDEPVQRASEKPGDEPVQREAADEQPVQTRAGAEHDPAAPSMEQAAAHAIDTRGAGQPLSPGTREALESRMGVDLGGVRVHNDGAAQDAAKQLGARAFTNKNDIWLGRGESPNDLRLMAHEATHVVQQGASAPPAPAPVARKTDEPEAPVQRQATPAAPAPTPAAPAPAPGAAPGGEMAPGELDIKGLTELTPEKVPAPIASYLDGRPRKTGMVKLRFGALAEGPAEVKRQGDKYLIDRESIALKHPLFARVAEISPELQPSLVLTVKRDQQITGSVGLKAGKRIKDLDDQIKQAPAILGLPGFEVPNLKGFTNKLEGGKLVVGARDFPIRLGKLLSGTFSVELADGEITTLEGKADVAAKGLATGSLELKKTVKEGAAVVTGKATIAVDLPKNFSGGLDVAWDGQAISGEGKVSYKGEKLSGSVTLKLMEKSLAAQLEQERQAPPADAGPAPAAAGPAPAAAAPAPAQAKGKPRAEDYVVFGEGDLNFAFTDWLNGSAHVIVDPKGFVTIIGKITPQKEFPLFEPKHFNKELFKVEARAIYGVPVVGNVFVFANISLSAFAGLQGKLYNITVQGTYSTDPEKAKDFSISGTLNVSASAGLTLRAEGGAGLQILEHDIKAGAGINAEAGIKGYAEATPTIGYREKGAPGEDKKGEFFIRGDVEVVGQPFLGLNGDLFVELDSPWWSPAPDKKWTWPLGGKEWPVGGSFGVGLTVDYVFGSGQAPALEFKKPEFSADKFMTDMVESKAKEKAAAPADQKAKWNERNSKAAEPPAGPSKPGNAQPGKAAPPAPAKSPVKPGGAKQPKKPADPNAATTDGKTVKQHQQDAAKKGKGPGAKDAKGDPGQQLKEGLDALDAVTARYAKDGASKDEVETGVKSVRRKFKVFKSITVIDGGDTWDYEYVASPATKKKGAKKKATIDTTKLQTGTAVLGKDGVTKQTALGQLALITKPDQVSAALAEMAKTESGILERYKGNKPNKKGKLEGYKQYLDPIKSGAKFEWPLTYLARRSSLSRGKKKEAEWKDKVYPGAGPKEFQIYEENGWQIRIPDIVSDSVIGDVKNVKKQDFDLQLRSFYTIAKLRDPITNRAKKVKDAAGNEVTKTRNFELIVRDKTHSDAFSKTEGTYLSQPLAGALDKVHRIITDSDEEE